MAERKQLLSTWVPDEELLNLLAESKDADVTEDVLHEQRVSFAYGNALNRDDITKESVRHSSRHIRLSA